MMRFGPSGNSDRFYAEGYKKTEQAPAWVAAMGLNAYEYSAGHGVSMGEATARAIGGQAQSRGVALSIHAPYYINCASELAERRDKSIEYLLSAARAIDWMGYDRVVFHVGSPGKLPRPTALHFAQDTILRALDALGEAGLAHVVLCPETMGRESQLGALTEILALCALDARLLPTLDFGHLHAAGQGALKGADDFRRVLDQMLDALGYERARHFHAHFSKLEYTAKGEKRHVTFADEGAGPNFELLAPLLLEYKLEPTVICESAGTQADDALQMMRIVESLQGELS